MEERGKILYIISNAQKALEFEWAVEALANAGFEIAVLLLNPEDSELEQFYKSINVSVQRITYRSKKDAITAAWKIFKYISKFKPNTVHTHLIDATIIGLLMAWIKRVPQRIYTRHHSSWHHIYHKHAVKWDKFNNRHATDIVAISQVVKDILIRWEKVKETKVTIIHHGIDQQLFENVPDARVQSLKDKYSLADDSIIVGVISRWTEWKGIQYIIPAFKELLVDYPNAVLILANAKGDYELQIRKLLDELSQDSYRTIKFESDLFALFQLLSVFVHTPIDYHSEAFGQIYIEAHAAGIPMICTLSGIGNEMIQDGENAIVAEYKDSGSILTGIKRVVEDPALRTHLITNGKKEVAKYSLNRKIEGLINLYSKTK